MGTKGLSFARLGTKRHPLLSRTSVPGWETGTTAVSQHGQQRFPNRDKSTFFSSAPAEVVQLPQSNMAGSSLFLPENCVTWTRVSKNFLPRRCASQCRHAPDIAGFVSNTLRTNLVAGGEKKGHVLMCKRAEDMDACVAVERSVFTSDLRASIMEPPQLAKCMCTSVGSDVGERKEKRMKRAIRSAPAGAGDLHCTATCACQRPLRWLHVAPELCTTLNDTWGHHPGTAA